MEQDEEFELIVHEGKRPLWQSIVAAILFSLMFYLIYQSARLFYYFGYSDFTLKSVPHLVYGIAYCLVLALGFSVVKSVLIDIDKDKLVSRFTLGPFSYDQLSAVPSLEYVSVFKDARGGYDVNLWYIGNKHYVMCDFYDSEPAFVFARYVATKLNLELLDATVKGDSKWIEVNPSVDVFN